MPPSPPLAALAERLTSLAPAGAAYAQAPIEAVVDWPQDLDEALEGDFYLVAFRSIRRSGADEELLWALDARAHDEAARSDGFIAYFQGPLLRGGECLSFCLWESRAQARAAAAKPEHRAAMAILHEAYATYELTFHAVTKVRGERSFRFAPYDR